MNAAAELAVRLRAMQTAARGPAVIAAANAAGRAGETMTKTLLTRRTHQAGTPTPSAPGQPPALVSGDLRRSVQRTPAVLIAPGIAVCEYGPVVIYGIVQEFGMTITVRNKKVLASRKTGQVFGPRVTLPARPFMRPAVVILADSGTFARVTGHAFRAALLA